MSANQVAKNKVVSIHYTLKTGAGDLIDSSEGDEPLSLLWGAGQVVEGLEKALAGRAVGEKLQVEVSPEDGYGPRTSTGQRSVPSAAFPEGVEVEEGMCFDVEDDDGNVETFWVVEVLEDEVVIDLDHPLAGETLNFAVEIVNVRDATAEEIDHGHAH